VSADPREDVAQIRERIDVMPFRAGDQAACVFRRSRSRFRDDADRHSGVMAITIGAKRRWLVS